MDFDAVLAPLRQFFATDLGAVIGKILEIFYALLYPSNAEAAHLDDATTAVDAAKNAVADK